MAKANLTVDESITAAFASANETGRTRAIHVTIEGERLNCVDTSIAGADFAADFDAFAGTVGANDPRIVLFTAGAQADGVPPGTALEWGLLSYVPDTANVRLKMLYASSREDLKRALGLNYFGAGADYYQAASDVTLHMLPATSVSRAFPRYPKPRCS